MPLATYRGMATVIRVPKALWTLLEREKFTPRKMSVIFVTLRHYRLRNVS